MVLTRYHLGAALALAMVLIVIPEGHCQGYPVWTDNLQRALSQEGINEDIPAGTFIGRLRVDHPQPVTFLTNSSYLNVDKNTGDVTLARAIDRETMRNFPVSFVAVDARGNSATVGYRVVVRDVNDNAPVFEGTVDRFQGISIREDAAIGTTVLGGIDLTDVDADANSEVRLSCFIPDISEGTLTIRKARETCEMFDIRTIRRGSGRYTGVITLRQALDYEKDQSYLMTLVAVDNGSPQKSTFRTVSVVVKNVADSLPRFVNAPITINILENVARDTKVGELHVHDGGRGATRPLRVKIVQGEDGLGWFRLGLPEVDTNNRWYVVPIYSNGNLNREAIPSVYKFDVEAVELDGQGAETTSKARTTVFVNVADYNDNGPQFNKRSYEITVLEGLGQLSPLPGLDMVVQDPDLGSNSEFSLQLQKDQWGSFSVSPSTCTGSCAVSLAVQNPRAMDYEDGRYRRQIFEVVARETKTVTQRSSTATVTVNLRDTNDNEPFFSQTRYAVSVREDRRPGDLITTITATDSDSGDFGTVRYRLLGTSGDRFVVDEVTGEIRLARKLDFERQSLIELQFEARDLGGKTKTVPFRVSVLNFNEQGPVFGRDRYQVSLSEGSGSGTYLTDIRAEDREQTGGTVTYRIVSGNTPDAAFQIERNTGRLSLRRPVRFEESAGGVFRLVVEASDSGNPPQTTTVPVIISISDVNSFSPQFTRAVYTTTVSEVAFPGTSVVTVQATDRDSGQNGRVTYMIRSGSLDNFVINSQTGLITVSRPSALDTGVGGSTYNMIVYAVDGGSPQRTGTSQVIVTITDANNQPPRFLQNIYVAFLTENEPSGTLVLRLLANDPDTSSRLQYSMRPSTVVAKDRDGQNVPPGEQLSYRNAFLVNGQSGEVRTQRQVSRDKVSQISFIAEVRDTQAQVPSVQTATATVIVNIRSSVDNRQRFNPPWSETNPQIPLTIPEEEAVGRVITTFRAIDPNTNRPANNYEKVRGTDVMNYFRVDRQTGQVSLNRRVDYETLPNKELSFQVRVTGTGSPPLSSVARVAVKVVDINDNSPKFLQSFYSFSVEEGRQLPARTGVMATDADSGRFGEVRYSLTGRGSNTFYLDPVTGYLTVANNGSLDRERTSSYSLLVKATDNPGVVGGRLFTDVPLTVTVLDSNDNTPIFQQKVYNIERLETTRAGTTLGEFLATDRDGGTNGQIIYILEKGNDDDLFLLDPKTGVLTSRVDLEGSARDAPYVLQIRAEDRGIPTRSATAVVNLFINDLQGNNEAPRISFPSANGQVIRVKEGTPIGANVTKITASARGGSALGNIQYRFLSNSDLQDQTYFDINPFTGVITVKRPLDREAKQLYQLIVVVEDTLFNAESTRRFVINVTDVNDNVPSFWNCPGRENKNPRMVSVLEGEDSGTEVTRVQACDRDKPPFDKMSYYFVCGNDPPTPTSKAPFTIDKRTGVIKTAITLDREVKTSYLLCVKVSNSDQYNATQVDPNTVLDWTIQKVHVDVTDVDDHGPSFTGQDTITTGVLETAPFRTPIVTIRAMDGDSNSAFTRVSYNLSNIVFLRQDEQTMAADSVFLIGADTGTVFTNKASLVDYRNGYFSMIVTATDAKSRKATAKLVIYTVRGGQQLKFVFNKTPKEVSANQRDFIREVNDTMGSVLVSPDALRFHVTDGSDFDRSRTDLCFHMVENNRVLDPDDALKLLEDKKDDLEPIYYKYLVIDTEIGLCSVPVTTVTWSEHFWMWWILVALTLFMILIALILICLLCYWYKRYRRRMGMYKPYVVVDPTLNFNYPEKDYEWQETTVKMD